MFTIKRISRARPSRLLLAATCFHLLTACAIYLAGRLSILPANFDSDVSGGFALDSFTYQQEARMLAGILSQDGIAAWLRVPFELHVYLYSLCFTIFSPLFGFSVLAVEPLNLLYYLSILTLIYRIGKEAFGRTAGLAAAIVIGLWPSFLLHTLQLLKDPLAIVGVLALVSVCLSWLMTKETWRSALWRLLLGGTAVALLARMKSNMWESVLIIISTSLVLLLFRQARTRQFFAYNSLCAALLMTFALVMPLRLTGVHRRDQQAIEVARQDAQSSFVWTSIGARLAQRRRSFILNSIHYGRFTRSTVDGDVLFDSAGDIVRYVPRATLIGLFAPFPQMWFASDASTGRAARLLSGAETLLFYFIALAAGVGAYVERRKFSTWFLLLSALVNLVALGLVVTNIGALYRLRYVFWMLIIIMGARGALILTQNFRARKAIENTKLDSQVNHGNALT